MRIIAIALLLFTFSCTTDSTKSNVDKIEVTQEEITEVIEMEEESEYLMPHFRDMDLSNAYVDQEGFDHINGLIKYAIQLQKTTIEKNQLETYKALYVEKIEKSISFAENMEGEANSYFINFLQDLLILIDTVFDNQKSDGLNDGLMQVKIYLSEFHKIFPKSE